MFVILIFEKVTYLIFFGNERALYLLPDQEITHFCYDLMKTRLF